MHFHTMLGLLRGQLVPTSVSLNGLPLLPGGRAQAGCAAGRRARAGQPAGRGRRGRAAGDALLPRRRRGSAAGWRGGGRGSDCRLVAADAYGHSLAAGGAALAASVTSADGALCRASLSHKGFARFLVLTAVMVPCESRCHETHSSECLRLESRCLAWEVQLMGALPAPRRPGARSAAEVDDRSDGTYALRFAVSAAGPFQLALAAPGAGAGDPGLVFEGLCRPGRAAAAQCRVAAANASVVAGRSGRIRIARADSFGNAVNCGAGQPALMPAWQGPGPVTSAVTELRGGGAEVCFSARAAGSYAVELRCRDQPGLIGGAALAVRVVPGPACAPACSAALAGAAATGGVPVGDTASLTVDLRDACGNATADLGGQVLEVGADGPADLAFAPGPEGAGASFRAEPAVAGDYAVTVRLGGAPLPGWPRVLHAAPAASDAARCWLSGPALAGGATVGEPATVTLHTVDTHGNARGAGGEPVTASLHGGPARAVPATVDTSVRETRTAPTRALHLPRS